MKSDNEHIGRKRMQEILDEVLLKTTIGEFNLDMPEPDEECDITPLYCAVKLLIDSVKEKVVELEKKNKLLDRQNKSQSLELDETHRIAKLGSWEWDVKTDLLFWSPQLYLIYGFEPGKLKLSYQRFISMIHPDDRERVIKIIYNAFETKESFDFYHKIVKRDGSEAILQCIGKVETDEFGNVSRMFGTGQDVTELKTTLRELRRAKQLLEVRVEERTRDLERAYKELQNEVEERILSQQSERKLAEIVRASGDAIVGYDIKGLITTWNEGATSIYGYNAAEVIGKNIKTIIPRGKRIEYNEIIKKIKSGKKVDHFETVRQRKDGEIIHVNLTLSPVSSNGKITGISSVAKDISERVMIKRSLESSELRYKTLVENMNEGVLVVDNDDKVQFANTRFCEEFGYKLEEILDVNAMETFLQKEDQRRMKKLIKDRRAGKSSEYDVKMVSKDGTPIWMHVNGSPLYDANGNVIGSVGLHTNITKRKEYEKALDAIAKFPEEDPDPVIRFSIENRKIIYTNKPAKVLVESFSGSEMKEKREEWLGIINDVYVTGKIDKRELQLNDQAFMCTMVPIKAQRYVNIYATDITAIKQAEKAVEHLSFILSRTDNAILVADRTGRIQWVNDAFTRISGFSLEDVRNTHGESLRHGARTGLDKNHPQFQRMIKTRQSVSYESKNYRKNDEPYWSFTTLTPILNEDGEIESIVAIDADITARKEAEKEMLKAKRLAEDTAKAKERFLANMSHEIRTPMNAIMGLIQILRDTNLTKEQTDYLKSMSFAGENLLRIVNDVLDLSKIESGKLSVERIPYNLKDLLANIHGSIAHKAQEKGLELNTSIAEDLPDKLIGDPVRINQVLINLIGNAIKFTDKGSVSVSASLKSKSTSRVLQLVVKDTGIGIPENMIDSIFKEFEQVHSENTRQHGGTGLGLAIVKRLVSAMGGDVKLKSKLNQGSEFTINLPLETANGDSLNEVDIWSDMDTTLIQGLCVLLVEDNKLNQLVAKKFLESIGAEVDIANHGLEAIAKHMANNYELILMDIQMPEMDGYSATKHIRKQFAGKKAQVKIIAMTAHAISGEREKCIEAGMDNYLTKPLRKEVLTSMLINTFKTKRHVKHRDTKAKS